MEKPRLLIVDWKPIIIFYDPILDLITYEKAHVMPRTLEGYAGMIAHNPALPISSALLAESHDHQKPLFFQQCDSHFAQFVRERCEGPLYFPRTYEDLHRVVRDVFG